MLSVDSSLSFGILLLAAQSLSYAQPERIVVGSVAELQACVDRPAGAPLICALRGSSTPYAVSGTSLTIRRNDTTIEGAPEPGQDPPTLRRTDPALKKMILVHKFASNVTIRNLQLDGNSHEIPVKDFQDISVEGSGVTVENNHFGNSAYYCVFFGGPHFTLRNNRFGEFIVNGEKRPAPGIDTAVKAWGPNATQFTVDSNNIAGYRGAMSITDAPGGTDPATAGVISNNTLYHNGTCVPNCGGGQIYLAGKTTNVKVIGNTIDGGWRESENRDTVHSYGLEIDKAGYILTRSNKIFNNAISGIWIGNGANHITLENDAVYNNGLNGVQISGGPRATVSDISILGLASQHNDQQRSLSAPYPRLPRYFGVMVQDSGATKDLCIQNDSNLGTNSRGAVYAEGRYNKGAVCPRPY
ncbi:MAG TPA: right-handed parallel beta-helix repeat-containing protein [Bryobacteraceae bacterium]|nr:right-handed parallel beta-helix repeat-containing protein [Bryobacteraceae bacterium]